MHSHWLALVRTGVVLQLTLATQHLRLPLLHSQVPTIATADAQHVHSLLDPVAYLQHRLRSHQRISNHQLRSFRMPVLIHPLKQLRARIKDGRHLLLLPLVEADMP